VPARQGDARLERPLVFQVELRRCKLKGGVTIAAPVAPFVVDQMAIR
jgi:hypothetical protein